MTNFIIGAIFTIAAIIISGLIMDRREAKRIREELGEDFKMVIVPKSKMNIQRNVTICLQDNKYTAEHLDDDKNIIAFMTFHPNNIKSADFYYSLFTNEQIITIDYEFQMYKAIITQIKLINEDTLRIYYTVLKN